jgi:hypothetical protein
MTGRLITVCSVVLILFWTSPAPAAELQARTLDAFDRYVRLTEERMARELNDASQFLWTDALLAQVRPDRVDALRAGELLIERLTTQEVKTGRPVDVPDGLIHHWIGVVFVPGATLGQAVALLQDYDRHAELYRPAIARSKLLSRADGLFRVYLRFYTKKVITVVLNSEHEARFTHPSADRAFSRIVSTRIAEVSDPDTPRESEKPVGRDSGYLWRLNTYWRFLERDGGTYVQCESISLTRDLPFAFAWLIRPFVTSVPRESLEFTLTRTRQLLGESLNRR